MTGDEVMLTNRIDAALAELADPNLAELEAGHVFIGPTYSSDDGLGRCACGDADCEVSAALGIIERVRLALTS